MTRTDAFFDTNVLLYLGSDEERRAEAARELLIRGGTVSVQVLNEYVSATRGKFGLPWSTVEIGLDGIRTACRIVPLTIEIHERGLAYAKRYRLAIYDAMIVAAAVLAGCTTLYTEDMHTGLAIDGLMQVNPFARD